MGAASAASTKTRRMKHEAGKAMSREARGIGIDKCCS